MFGPSDTGLLLVSTHIRSTTTGVPAISETTSPSRPLSSASQSSSQQPPERSVWVTQNPRPRLAMLRQTETRVPLQSVM